MNGPVKFVKSENELNNFHFAHSGCGKITDFFHKAVFKEKVFLDNDARKFKTVVHEVSYCPDCFRLKDIRKKCLKCEKSFRPACNASHLCLQCIAYNKNAEEEEI